MYINIEKLLKGFEPSKYSASIAELGTNAGRITWINAMECVKNSPILNDASELQAMRDYLQGFGAWNDSEINGFSDIELNALLVQMIAGDMREGYSDRISCGEYDIGD